MTNSPPASTRQPDAPRAPEAPASSLRPFILVGLHLAGWVLYGIAYYLTLRSYQPFGDILWKQTLVASGSGLLFSTLLGGLYRALRLSRRRPVEQVLIALGTSLAFGLAWYQVKAWGVEWVDPFVVPVTRSGAFRPGEGSLLSSAPAFPVLLLVWSGVYLSIAQWYARQTQERRRNTIGALADENPQRVKAAVRELSGFLRYTLLDEEALDAPLRDEFEAAEHYLAVEKIRFEDDLAVEVNLADEAAPVVVPSFLVLPLVENAVKHGQHTSPMPLRIRVAGALVQDALAIDVANTGHWRGTDAEDGTGTGLANVRRRLEARYPEQHQFTVTEDDDWVRARIEIDMDAFDSHA
ncbi:MAG: sensor histidine kinase [Bacteroidetes bacterium QH_10_64_19]|nr:MAG: sensor histidine kinase [Bacteroidetes bacterium QH_10_64_19]